MAIGNYISSEEWLYLPWFLHAARLTDLTDLHVTVLALDDDAGARYIALRVAGNFVCMYVCIT